MSTAPLSETPDVDSRRRLRHEAHRCQPLFCGQQLRAVRELVGLNQREACAAVGVTASSWCQAEAGRTRLSVSRLATVSELFDTAAEAFITRPDPEMQLAAQIRQPRRVNIRAQRRAERLPAAAVRLRDVLDRSVRMPTPWTLHCPVDVSVPAAEAQPSIELAAAAARAALGLDGSEPAGPLVDRLVAVGVIVVRDTAPDLTAGAYGAIIDNQPVIVLAGPVSGDRDNYDLAHELGHIVMHRGSPHRCGARGAEQQARRFAAALLCPVSELRLSDADRIDWPEMQALKRRLWMPMAEIVDRAHTLGRVTDTARRTARKHCSAHGWLHSEPGDALHPPQRPAPLPQAALQAGLEPRELAAEALLPAAAVELLCASRPAVRWRALP